MSEKIEPALSAGEWTRAEIDDDGSALRIVDGRLVNEAWGQPVDRPAAVIALANAALSDSDPRKITREWVKALRDEAERAEYTERVQDNAGYSAIEPTLARQIADALESYLPPEIER